MNGGSHLSPDVIIDVAEERGSPQALRHAAECARCRDQVAEVRAALTLAAGVDVPEPSPLYWDHLAARIGDAIATEPVPAAAGWFRGWRLWASATVAAAAVLVLAVAVTSRLDDPGVRLLPAGPVVTTAGAGEAAGADVNLTSDLDDGTWALVTVLSAELDGDELEMVALEPVSGTAERVLDELSLDEQGELVRLLEEELARRPL
jgi:anti-sigma-K factor RskA